MRPIVIKKKKKREPKAIYVDDKIVFELIDLSHGTCYHFCSERIRDVAYDILTNRKCTIEKSAVSIKHTFIQFCDSEIPNVVKEIQSR